MAANPPLSTPKLHAQICGERIDPVSNLQSSTNIRFLRSRDLRSTRCWLELVQEVTVRPSRTLKQLAFATQNPIILNLKKPRGDTSRSRSKLTD